MTHNLRADTVTMTGYHDDEIEAYLAVPTDVEGCGSVVVIHHMPGYDEAHEGDRPQVRRQRLRRPRAEPLRA